MTARIAAVCVLNALLSLLLAGCERQVRSMYDQPRYEPGAGSVLWPDGRAERPAPPGTVPAAAGDLAGTSGARRGRGQPAQWQVAESAASAPPIEHSLLARGRERYEIYCLPCHSAVGDGDGPVVRHGFPRPPSYHQDRLRNATDRYLFDVITHGHGVMYSYADRVAPGDRWAIVAYIRALQLSQHAQVAQLPAPLRRKVLDGVAR